MFSNCFLQPSGKVFLRTTTMQYSYGWLQDRLKKIVGLFRSKGINSGDRIILATNDDIEIGVIFLAALSEEIGVIIIDPDTKAPRVKAIIDTVSPALIIADEELLEEWSLSSTTTYPILAIGNSQSSDEGNAISYHLLLESCRPVTPNEFQEKSSLAYIMFTSGTTSDPKGVAITHENLQVHLNTLQNAYSLTADSQILNQLILSHADGLIQGPVLAAFTGSTWHRPFRFSISQIGELLDYTTKSGITHFIAVPTMLHFIDQYSEGFEHTFRNPAFKLLISVSANLPKSLWESFEEKFAIKLSNVYGLTETVAGSLFCIANSETYKRNTIGKPIDCLIKIVDQNYKEVQPGSIGELCLKGPHIMNGYWQNDARTNEVIIDGWLHTGDYATIDNEGYVSISGRKKNTIISGGLNIQPEEITESLLYNNAISEAFAFGMEDEILGDKLVVAVVPAPDVQLTEAEVLSFCAARLEKKMMPQKIYLLKELPKGISGKVQLDKLRQLCISIDDKVARQGSIESVLLSIVSEIFQLPLNEVEPATDFFKLGGDSLLAALFIAKIEQAFKVKVHFRDIFKNSSVRALAVHILFLLREKNNSNLKDEQNIKVEITRIGETSKPCKLVILANDYYEVNEITDYLKNDFDCYFLQYKLNEKYAENRQNGIEQVPLIEEIAAEITEQLLSEYIVDRKMILMGFSFGGLLAYEISKILLKQKAITNHKLIMLDAVVSDFRYPFFIRYRVKFRRKIDTIQLNIKNKVTDVSRRFAKKGMQRDQLIIQHKHFVENHNATKNAYFDLAKKVINSYTPKGMEEADVVLITSEKNEARNENNRYWLEKIKSGLTIVNVPGNHMTFLKEPHLSAWMPTLKQLLHEKCNK